MFVDGDFWHGHAPLPKSNREWWKEKIRRNVLRDRAADRALRRAGWIVVRLLSSTLNPPIDAASVKRIVRLRMLVFAFKSLP